MRNKVYGGGVHAEVPSMEATTFGTQSLGSIAMHCLNVIHFFETLETAIQFSELGV